jgi:UDP-2-acetamido-3-amino-2,3-dideoxy-glucuronate N-acetyltransferase
MAIHSSAIILSRNVPALVEIGPFTLVCEDAVISDSACIGAQVMIGISVQIGPRVRIQSGACISDGCIIESDVTVGANASVASGVCLHMGSSVTAGTNVTMDVPPYAIISGPESAIAGYVDANLSDEKSQNIPRLIERGASRIRGVRLYELPNYLDMRGNLSVGEFEKDLPFYPKRFFVVYDVTNERIRGEHAHYKCHQFLQCTHGACSIIADDGFERQEFRLDKPNRGIYLPPMIWGIQYKFTRDAVLLVFTSEHYDPEDYIRNFAKFREIARSKETEKQ